MTRALACLMLIAACGGESRAPAAGESATPSLAAEGRGRVVVAEVDGAPIYGDCVAAQARENDLDRQAALEECIGFELLAREAARQGYADDPAVLAARKTESARALIAADFLATYDGPEDISMDDLHNAWRGVRGRFNHPEIRFTFHVRAEVPKGASEQAENAAEKLASEIARAFAGKEDVSIEDFKTTAQQVAGKRPLHIGQSLNFARHSGAAEKFAAATFAIPRAGMVSPPIRTRWGWDVILLNDILPAASMSLAEAEDKLREKLFPAARVKQFERWAVAKTEAAAVTIHEAPLEAAFAEAGNLAPKAIEE